ncbi:MAG TPA: alpha/beta hydrolase [Caulobacteraceae bacterium]|nr:alpha/beta hydrolase [Caulobacteraceae bacterium]
MPSSKHLVHPELVPGLEAFPAYPAFTVDAATLPLLRSAPPRPQREVATPGIGVEGRVAPGSAGGPDVRVLVYRPKAASEPRPAILHVHGGGYVLGSAQMSDVANRVLARDLDCVIVSVDYRLAPETRFPGNLEDCYAGLKWLHANAPALGVDASRVAIKGESAGGGLAAGLALLARDRGEVAVAYQMLIYPMIDDREHPEPHGYVGEFIWNRESNRFGWASILGREPGGEGVSPYAAAARAETLAGLPATFIAVGALDLFLEENLEYARRLMRAGVPVELHVYPGAFHGFGLVGETALSRRADRDELEALRQAFAATSCKGSEAAAG